MCECCPHASSPPFHVINDDCVGYVAYIQLVRQPIVDLDILHHYIRPVVCTQQYNKRAMDSYLFGAVPSKSPGPNMPALRRCAGGTVVGRRLRAPCDTLCTGCKHDTLFMLQDKRVTTVDTFCLCGGHCRLSTVDCPLWTVHCGLWIVAVDC